ncbi:50S ribosomal protein L16 [Nanoarchaeota archaeon]
MAIKNPAPYKALQRPFTRNSKVRAKAYIRSVPPTAINKFVMGGAAKFTDGKYKFTVKVISKENAQIRDVALEAIRSQMHRQLENEVGTDYYMNLAVYPHQILREHKQAAVAQADRMSSGMSQSFGKAVGKAAQVRVGKPLVILGFNTESDINKFRAIYKKIKPKFCMTTSLEITNK